MKKVLIAEDNPDSLEIITFQMEMMGYSVIAAKHGQEAVEKAVEEEPQLSKNSKYPYPGIHGPLQGIGSEELHRCWMQRLYHQALHSKAASGKNSEFYS